MKPFHNEVICECYQCDYKVRKRSVLIKIEIIFMIINYPWKPIQDPSIMESDMFVNSSIIKQIEKRVYNNT